MTVSTDFVDILEVEPGVEGSDGEVQVRQLEFGHAGADVPFVAIDAEGGETEAALLQGAHVNRHREPLVEDDGERVRLHLSEDRT